VKQRRAARAGADDGDIGSDRSHISRLPLGR
jgi:hypothetical protein